MRIRASLAKIPSLVQQLPAIQARRKIPPHKRKRQWRSTIAGTIVFLGAFALPKYLGFPWQAALAVAAFGGWIASKELLLTFLKAIPEAVGALAAAVTKKAP